MNDQSQLKLISVKCPDCGASLSIEEGRKQAFCTYCGAKVLIQNDNEHVFRTIDEAAVAKAEAEKEIRLKELETEKANKKREDKTFIVTLLLVIVFFSAFILFWSLRG